MHLISNVIITRRLDKTTNNNELIHTNNATTTSSIFSPQHLKISNDGQVVRRVVLARYKRIA